MRKGVLFISDGKDKIQDYTLQMLAKALLKDGYESLVFNKYTSSTDLEALLSHYTPSHVVINDFIVLPDSLIKLKNKLLGVNFYIREVNTHKTFYNSSLFSLIREYTAGGIKVLTRTRRIFEFSYFLEKLKIPRGMVEWAPDVYLLPSFSSSIIHRDWRVPIRIGHYNRYMSPEENTFNQYYGMVKFADDIKKAAEFRVLSVNKLLPSDEVNLISDISHSFPYATIKVCDGLELPSLKKEIMDLDILSHVSSIDTWFIDFLAVSFNLPVITDNHRGFLKKYAQCNGEDVFSIAQQYKKIYRESSLKRRIRVWKQKWNANRHFQESYQKWITILER